MNIKIFGTFSGQNFYFIIFFLFIFIFILKTIGEILLLELVYYVKVMNVKIQLIGKDYYDLDIFIQEYENFKLKRKDVEN